MTILAIDRISLAFGGLTVLKDISIALNAGELLALIGPNGAGKTSIFNCISGLYRPTGAISFKGRSLLGRKPNEIAADGIARTFQHGEIPPHLSVLEAVQCGRHAMYRSSVLAEIFRLPSFRREEEAHRSSVLAILRLAEIEALAETKVGSLAFGTQKIVGVARALAAEPSVLLLDEPSAGLTQEEREAMARLIMRAKLKLGMPILWIEHDMQMVADLADRVHVLDYGRSLADGPPDAVLADPAVIKAYLGS